MNAPTETSVVVRVPGRTDARITRLIAIGEETWARLAPLVPPVPPRKPGCGGPPSLPDRIVLSGVLTVLANRIGFEALPVELGYGSGMTCWRRLRHWHQAGAWPAIAQRLSEVLPAEADIDLARVDRLFAGCGRPRKSRTTSLPATSTAPPDAVAADGELASAAATRAGGAA